MPTSHDCQDQERSAQVPVNLTLIHTESESKTDISESGVVNDDPKAEAPRKIEIIPLQNLVASTGLSGSPFGNGFPWSFGGPPSYTSQGEFPWNFGGFNAF